jgi:hypothetical protein
MPNNMDNGSTQREPPSHSVGRSVGATPTTYLSKGKIAPGSCEVDHNMGKRVGLEIMTFDALDFWFNRIRVCSNSSLYPLDKRQWCMDGDHTFRGNNDP